MVCRHCVESVRRLLETQFDFNAVNVELGAAEIAPDPTDETLTEIETALRREGFGLIRSREAAIIDEVKRLLIDLCWNSDCGINSRINLDSVLDGRFPLSYASLSRLFSQTQGRTLENYFLSLRLERVKEFMRYGSLTLSEIADRMGFSSVAHLSRQFKQYTGLTPTNFKALGAPRQSLAEI